MFEAEFSAAMERERNPSAGPRTNYPVDDLMDKLKLLNYEKLLLKELKLKPPHRRYFQTAKNHGEQFYLFTSLCAWLARNLGKDFDQPQEEFDDPSATIAKIMRILEEMEIPTDFPSNKLIQGGGPICVFILDCLATQVIKISGIKFDSPVLVAEEEAPMEVMENDAEIILEKVEEEQNALPSDDDDDSESGGPNMYLRGLSKINGETGRPQKDEEDLDTENWRLELERVLPKLKIVIRTDPRDWRAHVEQMKSLQMQIEAAKLETEPQLKKLETDIGFIIEKINSREKHLNNELRDLLLEYKSRSIELKQVETALADVEKTKLAAEDDLANVLGELETTKAQMEQRGSSMADGSPLVNIKKAIVKLKEEIIQMDLKIGVCDHSLTNQIMRYNAQISELTPVGMV